MVAFSKRQVTVGSLISLGILSLSGIGIYCCSGGEDKKEEAAAARAMSRERMEGHREATQGLQVIKLSSSDSDSDCGRATHVRVPGRGRRPLVRRVTRRRSASPRANPEVTPPPTTVAPRPTSSSSTTANRRSSSSRASGRVSRNASSGSSSTSSSHASSSSADDSSSSLTASSSSAGEPSSNASAASPVVSEVIEPSSTASAASAGLVAAEPSPAANPASSASAPSPGSSSQPGSSRIDAVESRPPITETTVASSDADASIASASDNSPTNSDAERSVSAGPSQALPLGSAGGSTPSQSPSDEFPGTLVLPSFAEGTRSLTAPASSIAAIPASSTTTETGAAPTPSPLESTVNTPSSQATIATTPAVTVPTPSSPAFDGPTSPADARPSVTVAPSSSSVPAAVQSVTPATGPIQLPSGPAPASRAPLPPARPAPSPEMLRQQNWRQRAGGNGGTGDSAQATSSTPVSAQATPEAPQSTRRNPIRANSPPGDHQAELLGRLAQIRARLEAASRLAQETENGTTMQDTPQNVTSDSSSSPVAEAEPNADDTQQQVTARSNDVTQAAGESTDGAGQQQSAAAVPEPVARNVNDTPEHSTTATIATPEVEPAAATVQHHDATNSVQTPEVEITVAGTGTEECSTALPLSNPVASTVPEDAQRPVSTDFASSPAAEPASTIEVAQQQAVSRSTSTPEVASGPITDDVQELTRARSPSVAHEPIIQPQAAPEILASTGPDATSVAPVADSAPSLPEPALSTGINTGSSASSSSSVDQASTSAAQAAGTASSQPLQEPAQVPVPENSAPAPVSEQATEQRRPSPLLTEVMADLRNTLASRQQEASMSSDGAQTQNERNSDQPDISPPPETATATSPPAATRDTFVSPPRAEDERIVSKVIAAMNASIRHTRPESQSSSSTDEEWREESSSAVSNRGPSAPIATEVTPPSTSLASSTVASPVVSRASTDRDPYEDNRRDST